MAEAGSIAYRFKALSFQQLKIHYSHLQFSLRLFILANGIRYSLEDSEAHPPPTSSILNKLSANATGVKTGTTFQGTTIR